MKLKKISFAIYKPVRKEQSTASKHEKLLKEKINKAARSIRRKYIALKLGKADEDETLNRILKPIIDPLKELKTSHISNVKDTVSYQNKKRKDEKYLKYENQEQIEKKDADDEDFMDSTLDDVRGTDADEISLNDYFSQYPPLTRQYIEGYFTKRKNYDKTYGVKFDLQSNNLYIGNMDLKFGDDSEIIIGDKIYDGSSGLYNLLFMNEPTKYDRKNLTDYKEILQITSAHKRNYDPLGQINGTRSSKYRKIIKPLFQRKKRAIINQTTSGEGMNMVYNERPIEYVYWDDVNELVDRLRLLNASKAAGNTDSHDNEILAIISELREARIIY